jgi:PBP1b-binding outer membrane lipoprotein LpoB
MKKIIIISIAIVGLIFTSGCSEELATKKAMQAEILQLYAKSFSEACEGELSMTMNFTGDVEKPVTTTMNCDSMKKDHEIFRALSKEDVSALKKQIIDLN